MSGINIYLVKHILNLNQILNEATIDDSKIGITYELSREGRNHAERLDMSTDITLEQTHDIPNDDIEVLHIRPSSIRVIELGSLKSNLGLTDDDFFFYESTSRKYPFVVVKKGTKTNMIRQKERVGVTKRGEHFRETAFIIIFASLVWKKTGVKLRLYSNRGEISMNYSISNTFDDTDPLNSDDMNEEQKKKFATIDEDERGAFRIRYEEFIANKSLYKSMIRQSNKLISFLGNSISNISFIVKNSNDLLINQMAKFYLDNEIESLKDLTEKERVDSYSFPKNINLAKWNPSDIWICYGDGTLSLQDSKWYDKNVSNLDELNDYLTTSIEQKNGLIGISLKQQQRGNSVLRPVNMLHDDVRHQFLNYSINNNIKTAIVRFSYKFSKNSTVYKDGELQIRTFDTSLTSSISIEVKGSKKAQHMSGKAGSLISSVMPPDRYKLLESVRKETDLEKIRELVNDYQFSSKDLRNVFYTDLSSEKKTQEINSRLQSCLLIDWLMSLQYLQRNRFVATIVKFAKSESVWSAPHIVLK